MMGGSGTRLGAALPKQFLRVAGKPIYQYILDLYAEATRNATLAIDHVVLVNNPSWRKHLEVELETYAVELPFPVAVVDGGSTRSESIRNGVAFMEKQLNAEDHILIHDATHPYLDVEATTELCRMLSGGLEAATLVTHVWDTVYRVEGNVVAETLPRAQVAVGASPEGFTFGFLRESFLSLPIDINEFTSVGNYAQAIGMQIGVVWSSKVNLKITYPEDWELFRQAKSYFISSNSRS